MNMPLTKPTNIDTDSDALSTPSPEIIELSERDMDGLIRRVRQALDDDLALSKDDLALVVSALGSLLHLHDQIGDHKITLRKLRQLLGLVSASEKLSDLINPKDDDNKSTNADDVTDSDEHQAEEEQAEEPAEESAKKPSVKPKKSGKKKPRNTVKATQHKHALEGPRRGDTCPDCGRGKLYKYEPATFLRIVGQTPFSAHRHLMERVRCNACQGYQTAQPSAEVLDDGGVGQQYGYSARALMALNKFYMGSPYYRQESLQALLGVPITASTLFDQCEHAVNAITPLFRKLCYLAGNAELILLDDTSHRILSQKEAIQKPDRRTGLLKSRTGVYSSGVVATDRAGYKIVLFETNIGHAGEWLDSLLAHRAKDAPPVKLMSDALSCNRPTQVDNAIVGLCNVHARREFADLIVNFESEVLSQLEQYQHIWFHEKRIKKKNLNAEQRRDYHHKHSLPVMEKIKTWGQTQLDTEVVEANSGLGKAIRYFIKHYHGLTRFCFELNMPLDNNEMEAMLKIVIRNRKNAMFFKTLAGASIGDVLTSVIATCHANKVNPFDYLVYLQRHQDKVRQEPLAWLPWNYQQNDEVIKTEA